MRRSHNIDNYADAVLRLSNASPEEQERIIRGMPPFDALMFDADFEAWAHQGQRPPPQEGWRLWLMMAGRGFGKTRAGAEWIFRLASRKPGMRIALAGASIADARSIMVEGVGGLLALARRQQENGKRVRIGAISPPTTGTSTRRPRSPRGGRRRLQMARERARAAALPTRRSQRMRG
jgi:phage terminase large subunit-like protein